MQSQESNAAGLPTPRPHLEAIDCLRGYAVLLVVTTHLTGIYAEVPFPVRRLTVLGWYGVQLFFMMSAFTLLRSWNREQERTGTVSRRDFFIRRYLRIAPAYYLGALLYFLVRPPEAGFQPLQLLASFTFTNAWSPWIMPTVAGRWTVVPGGWSIGVEFAFYALFPLIAPLVTTLRRAVIGFFAAILLGLACNMAAAQAIGTSVTPVELGNFLYFWLPNQLPVFLAGFALYYLLGADLQNHALLDRIAPYRYALLVLAVLLFLALGHVPMAHFIGDGWSIPTTIYVILPFALAVVSMVSGPTIAVNRAAVEMGKVSFSAYLLHFAVLDLMARFPDIVGIRETGVRAILAFAIAWPVVAVVVFLASSLQYRVVELPFMDIAKRLTGKRPPARA